MSCPRCNAPAAEETLREFGGVCPKCLLDFSEEQDAPAFPNLEIVEMVGQGGMGVVYKAVQKNLGRTVALKVLSPHLSADPEFVERFTREARALASMSHPNIVGIYDSGIHDHVPFLVMEYVDGTPLRKMLASKKLTPAQVLEVIPQICDALHYAHEHGVVHRDIKPENILIDRLGRVKIADFGLAKLASLDETRITRTGYVMGSPHYMAPEQFAHSGRVDHRADIYSLGVVFYEMLTGEVPMGRFKPPSEKASVDQRLDPVVLKSLEREPDDRWQTVDEVKRRVTRLDDPPAADDESRRRDRIVTAVLAAISVLTIAVLLALTAGRKHEGIGGPVLVIISGVILMALAATHFRFWKSKTRRIPPASLRRQSTMLAGAAAGVVLLAVAILVLVAVPVPPPPPQVPMTIAPPVIDAAPEPSQPAPKAVPSRYHHVKHQFRVDDLWPTGTDLPNGLERARTIDGKELLEKAGLPPGVLGDLEFSRGLDFQNGRTLIVGLQFRTELARRRWSNEREWKACMEEWHYHLFGDSEGVILIRHDGSAIGGAAKDMLESIVERSLAAKWPQDAPRER